MAKVQKYCGYDTAMLPLREELLTTFARIMRHGGVQTTQFKFVVSLTGQVSNLCAEALIIIPPWMSTAECPLAALYTL